MTGEALRLGFAVKVLGQADMKSNDARRWQQEPHLRVSLGYLDATLDYLARAGIAMYRISSDLAPYVTHPDLPQFHGQIAECAPELHTLGGKAKRLGIRLSFHPSQYILLNAPNPEIVEKSIRDLAAQAEMLDCMGLGPEAVVVTHVGGAYGDKVAGRARWIATYARLPEHVRRRLVLENDDIRYSTADVLAIHDATGVPLVFDFLHFWCNNPEGMDLAEAAARCLATWPEGVRPKIHFSSPRTEMRTLKRKNRATGKAETVLQPPLWTGHADYVNPFEFITFLRAVPDFAADVMLEAKAKDLALLRLRRDLPRYAPDVAARFGIAPAAGSDAEPDDEESADEA